MKHRTIFRMLMMGVLTSGLAGAMCMGAAAAAPERVSVHDPSVIRTEDGQYYVFGSHTAIAKSEDMAGWQQVNSDYARPENTPFYGNLQETLAEPFQWAGYHDGDCAGGYAVWAPDIIWNPYYEWENGDTGAYMLYTCTSSTWRRSAICFLVSRTFDGTYEYGDTLVYSGFTKNGVTDGNSVRDTKWDNDYLNLKELTEKGSANGGIDEISDNWFNGEEWNHNYAPNAIDPTVFFDKDGEKLYMVYGSWSGGLFLLELDRTTGEVVYPGVDGVDEVSGNFVDRYFGIHLAGGNHESGEGPYIEYDPETGYYYLYETYGGLLASGGYNMRMFRSENVSGPYVDARGQNAADNGSNNDGYGIKLMGNYSFYNQNGMRAAGHNSALIDEDGSHYLVYHQRFDIVPQTEAHQVRVHQQFINEDGWPVPAVYEYQQEQPEHYEDADVIGSYEFINHGTGTNGDMLPTQIVSLHEDGTIDGALQGTWKKSDSGRGYDYLTIEAEGGAVYKGFFFRQKKEDPEQTETMTFAAIGNNNETIWGSMAQLDDDAMVIGMAAATVDAMIPEAVNGDLELPAEVAGATVVWSSDHEEILAADGTFHAPEEMSKVVLTAEITCGEHTETHTYKLRAKSKAFLVYGFDFENGDGTFAPTEGSTGTGEAEAVGSAAVTEDETRGNVLQILNDEGAIGVNYLKLPEDTFAEIRNGGFTVAMWVNIGEETFEHSALFEADLAGDYPMTRIGANLFARINADAYSDVIDAKLSTNGERGIWQHVVYTADPYGMKVYRNGELIGEETKDLANCFKKKKNSLPMAANVTVGSGSIWGDEDCRSLLVGDVRIYNGVLTDAEIAELAR